MMGLKGVYTVSTPNLTEEMLYNFMLEAKTDKVKTFRKWIVSEVLP
ncbi:BRO family protein [Clostridium lacusfryxellense]|nr:BRO family protein [Clostridium lacusfryxellense]MBU3114627.1 hypothetical protein [Clostridium lacusfryxellense]